MDLISPVQITDIVLFMDFSVPSDGVWAESSRFATSFQAAAQREARWYERSSQHLDGNDALTIHAKLFNMCDTKSGKQHTMLL